MNKLLCAIALMCLPFISYAGDISVFKTYATNDQVTATNLNGNINSIVNVVNGGLDNNNADTTSGYRFMEVLGALPAAGTQGRVAYLTTSNTLNFDTGAAWNSAVSITSPAQGDILYYNGTAWAKLAAGTANYALVTNGAAANPAFEAELGWTKMMWVTYVPATDAVNDCYPAGITITNVGVGNNTVNFTVNFANANYCVTTGAGNTGAISGYQNPTVNKAVGSIVIVSYTDAGVALDVGEQSLFCFGD